MFSETNPITFREVEKSLPCVKGGGTACRDGGIVEAEFYKKQSLSRLRRQLPLHKGAFFMFTYALSIFLTSTAFVSTNTKYGIPLSRYIVFLQNCPLEYDPNGGGLFA